jgi:sugar phosphate isomerase/epimerase
VRLCHPDGTTVHLAYCTNVHPAEDLDGVLGQLRRFGEPIRAALGTDRLGLGLWLARDVAATLAADAAAVERLRRELSVRGLEVVTLNGFPYRGFHAARVKRAVYRPDWSEPERLSYTLDLARVLVGLLPDDAVRGSISTLPLGWRTPWPAQRRAAAAAGLARLGEDLATLAGQWGRPVRVGLEPEPGCVVETTAQAAAELAGLGGPLLGVCLDTCHLAVQFEEPAPALERLAAAGLPVVKVQASAALHAERPDDPATRAALGRFVEERFLHQTRVRRGEHVAGCDDLPEALAGESALPADGPWRVHFHVPVHGSPEAPLQATRDVLGASLDALFGGATAATDHVEVETYTWSVLPPDVRPRDDAGLVAGIAAEVGWVRDRLVECDLTEEAV